MLLSHQWVKEEIREDKLTKAKQNLVTSLSMDWHRTEMDGAQVKHFLEGKL